MRRPTEVDLLLPFAPIPVREYVDALEAELAGSASTSRLVPSTLDGNHLGGFRASSSTSRKAALDNYPRSGKQRHVCLLAVAASGERGVTSDEISESHHLRLYSVKPRLFELREGGWIEQHGTRRSPTGSMVDVYVLTDKGRCEVAAHEGALVP